MHFAGKEIPKDVPKALECFKNAANLGSRMAMENVGLFYLKGLGGKEDSTEAAKWLEMAAQRGHTTSMCYLADIYMSGRGIAHDPVKAYIWYSLGIKGGVRAEKQKEAAIAAITHQQKMDADRIIENWKVLSTAIS